jgi:amino acid transporter
MGVSYLLFSYATLTGFGYNGTKVAGAEIPFISVAHGVLAAFALFAFFAGLTSTLGVLISAVNSQCRLIFNAGREGLLPAWLGKVHPTRRTPVNAIFTFVGVAGAIIGVWALLHLIGGSTGQLDPIKFFVESSTLGTILLLVVYFLSNLALPFYYRRFLPGQFNVLKHVILPVLGMIAIAIPVYYLVKPGQEQPFNWFPYAALGVVVVSVIYAYILNSRDPGLADRVGSIIADE